MTQADAKIVSGRPGLNGCQVDAGREKRGLGSGVYRLVHEHSEPSFDKARRRLVTIQSELVGVTGFFGLIDQLFAVIAGHWRGIFVIRSTLFRWRIATSFEALVLCNVLFV